MSQSHQVEGYSDRSLVVGVLGLVVVVLIIYLAVESVGGERDMQRRVVTEQVRTVLDLSVANVAQTLGGVRENMRLYSRLPVAYGTRSRPLTQRLLGVADGVRSWSGMLRASAAHRDDEAFPALASTALGLSSDLPASAAVLAPAPPVLTPEGLIGFYRDAAVGLESATDETVRITAWALDVADTLVALGDATPVRPDVVWYQQILDRTLPASGPMLSLTLFDTAEQRVAEATRVDTVFAGILTRGVVRRALSGESGWFCAGSVSFNDAVGAPVWVVGTPIVGDDLRPVAVLVAVVNLGFLQNLANTVRVLPGAELMIVDEHGTALAHPRRAQVTSQANLRQANAAVVAVLKGDDGLNDIEYRGAGWLAGWRNLGNLKQAGLPRWGVVLMAPATSAFAAGDSAASQIYLMALLGIVAVAYFCRLIAASLEDI